MLTASAADSASLTLPAWFEVATFVGLTLLLLADLAIVARRPHEPSMKEAGVWVAGLEGVPEAESLYRADLHGALALVVGSEGSGISRLVRERCDYLVRLPMRGQVGSLNAAVAGSIALYAVDRQREEGA